VHHAEIQWAEISAERLVHEFLSEGYVIDVEVVRVCSILRRCPIAEPIETI
jgi:hypothetical protein